MDKIEIDSEYSLNNDTNNLHKSMSSDLDKEKFLTNQIMNYLFFEFHNIDLFSTYELERIISYAKFNKHKALAILEEYSKDEIMKMIEENELINLKKAKSDI